VAQLELSLSYSICELDACERDRCVREGLEARHEGASPFDRARILLDDVIEVTKGANFRVALGHPDFLPKARGS
jgi:hypothetical protein